MTVSEDSRVRQKANNSVTAVIIVLILFIILNVIYTISNFASEDKSIPDYYFEYTTKAQRLAESGKYFEAAMLCTQSAVLSELLEQDSPSTVSPNPLEELALTYFKESTDKSAQYVYSRFLQLKYPEWKPDNHGDKQ
jgi:hypothetical protein